MEPGRCGVGALHQARRGPRHCGGWTGVSWFCDWRSCAWGCGAGAGQCLGHTASAAGLEARLQHRPHTGLSTVHTQGKRGPDNTQASTITTHMLPANLVSVNTLQPRKLDYLLVNKLM